MGDKKVYQLFLLVILMISAKVGSQTSDEESEEVDPLGVCTSPICKEETKDTDCGSECRCEILHTPNGVCVPNSYKIIGNQNKADVDVATDAGEDNQSVTDAVEADTVCEQPSCTSENTDCGSDKCRCVMMHPPNGVCLPKKNYDPCSRPFCSQGDEDCGSDCLCVISHPPDGACLPYTTSYETLADALYGKD